MHELPTLEDDGLFMEPVKLWAERKYGLVRCYAQMFATAMKDKWDRRVYVDLFAGSGRARFKGTRRIVPASPLLALGVSDPFDRYVFCEESIEKLDALRRRVDGLGMASLARFVDGDVNTRTSEILSLIPKRGTLTLCFADPYAMSNLRFRTIEHLSSRYVDFLILIPTGYDATRWWKQRSRRECTIVEEFLGLRTWREKWEAARAGGASAAMFLMKQYETQMRRLGYTYGGVDTSVEIRIPDKNVRLYRLGFFSRNKLGGKFWNEARRYAAEQTELDLA